MMNRIQTSYGFKFSQIDNTNNIPKNITIVPTIIDTTIEAPLEGKKAFEYVINQKYFNHPTNNVEYIKTHLFCGYYRYNEKCVARCSTDISSITHTIHFELFESSYYTLLNQLKFLNLLEAEEIIDFRLVELILHTGIKSINIIFDKPLDFNKK